MRIKGGYYIKARQIQSSKIATQPPHVREIWDWLLKEANHKDVRYSGFIVKRGQLFRTYRDIREGLHWMVGYRKMMYNENQTKKAMKFLREERMINTSKELGGVLITICNYDFYQSPKNYESANEGTNERTNEEPMKNHPIPYNNKNIKNNKNEKNINIPAYEEFLKYAKTLSIWDDSLEFQLQAKYESWVENKWKDGNGKKIKNWKTKLKNTIPYFRKNGSSYNKVNYGLPAKLSKQEMEKLVKEKGENIKMSYIYNRPLEEYVLR